MADNASDIARAASWGRVLSAISGVLADYGAFAFGDSCVAAIHYQDFFPGQKDCCFAAPRAQYQAMLPALQQAAQDAGLDFDGFLPAPATVKANAGAPASAAGAVAGTAEDRTCNQSLPKPYLRIGEAGAPADHLVTIYPLDCIPEQVTLRFKVFKEANRLMAAYQDALDRKDCQAAAKACQDALALQRYNPLSTGLLCRLCGYSQSGAMGERTVFQRTVDVDNVYPLRSMPLHGVQVPVAARVDNWTTEPTSQRQELISIIQRENLESMVEVDRVCKQLGITYFLVGGTMLGACRHKGYIPWDDDTDIGMLRPDYEKFCAHAQEVLKPEYFVQTPETDPHNHFVYIRLRKTGAEYITLYNDGKDFHKGLWVDIFPFDARPKSSALAKVQNKLANLSARASMGFKRRREYINQDMTTDISVLPASDQAFLRRYHLLAKFFPVSACRGAYHLFARMFNPLLGKGTNPLYASFIPTYTTISKSEVFPINRVPFETEQLDIPCGADAFLTRQYGDYMSLPPVHQRYCEHGFKYLRLPDGRLLR